VVVGCWGWAGGVVVERWPNMASMVGHSAAPRGVERKSMDRSNRVIVFLAMGG
jgi:hypothetical protein